MELGCIFLMLFCSIFVGPQGALAMEAIFLGICFWSGHLLVVEPPRWFGWQEADQQY
jgi:hypothetical protein